MAKDYSKFTHDELIKYIEELKAQLKSEKYGLYWDKSIEQENEIILCQKNLPILVRKSDCFLSNSNNILINGDNYHSLVCLNYILKDKIDVIYIDPPYNTGNEDFTYNDKFVNKDDGYRHSKWLTKLHKRLTLAKELLSDSGKIFVSIDDNEQANLKLLMDSIFGEKNFVCNFIWEKTVNPNATYSNVGVVHEYVFCYSKGLTQLNKIAYSEEEVATYSFTDDYFKVRGPYKLVGLNKTGTLNDLRPNLTYDIIAPDGQIIKPKPRWRWSKEKLERGIEEGRVVFSKKNNKWTVYYKQYFLEDTEGKPVDRGSLIKSIINDCGRTTNGSQDLSDILGKGKFDFPKPVSLIKRLVQIASGKNSIVLDFFAGSGTTGQAVLELNKEDGGNRRFILCTNNENNICTDVTYPRLKTVITGIRPDGTKYSDGIPTNLIYYKTDFIKDSNNTDQAKYCLVEKVDELLCISEDIFVQLERNDYSSHYVSNDETRHMFIYSDYYNETKFNEFKQRVLSASGIKVVYIFSSDNNVDETLFDGIHDVEVKPIPSKIYEIYKEIVEDIKRG